MRIDSGNIGMDSARLYQSRTSSRMYVGTTIRDGQWTGGSLGDFMSSLTAQTEPNAKKEGEKEASSKISTQPLDDAMNRMETNSARFFQNEQSALEKFRKLHELMVRNILELLFGGPARNSTDEALQCADSASTTEYEDDFVPQYELVSTYDHFAYSVKEYEYTSFSATGTVKTDDGRSIDINLNISMSRSFEAYYEETHAGTAFRQIDPLVLNFSDVPAGLKDMDFFFDLDSDGTEDKIKTLAEGSGFLALDKNGDGIINDGSELFGTKTGDGFFDLSLYDEDHNGWIDENDSIFEKLKIWTKDPNGKDILYTLKDKDIGALYLGNADTNFSLTNALTNDVWGTIRKTGMFLYEDGTAGSLQHVDLVS